MAEKNETVDVPKSVKISYKGFLYEGDYHSYATLIPDRKWAIKYLKEEIERAASINPQGELTIGIGITHFVEGIHLAREASERKELSDNLSAQEAEIELREYAKRFSNVKSVSINTGPVHISKMPIWVIGNYSRN